jgi:hypothetical protein
VALEERGELGLGVGADPEGADHCFLSHEPKY